VACPRGAARVDDGKITATIEIPSRNQPKSVLLRLRHPHATPLKRLTVNGKNWRSFDNAREVIRLDGLRGTVTVSARY
jgi:hypothetical protein